MELQKELGGWRVQEGRRGSQAEWCKGDKQLMQMRER